MWNMKWNITQKLHPTLKSSISNTCNIHTHSAYKFNAHAVSKGCTLTILNTTKRPSLGLTSEKWLSSFFPSECIWSYVRTYTCINVSKKIAQSNTTACELHTSAAAPSSSRFRYIDDKQISSDITSSPLSSTVTKKNNLWRTSLGTERIGVQFRQLIVFYQARILQYEYSYRYSSINSTRDLACESKFEYCTPLCRRPLPLHPPVDIPAHPMSLLILRRRRGIQVQAPW